MVGQLNIAITNKFGEITLAQLKRLSFSYNIHTKFFYAGLVLTSVIITFCLNIMRPESGFLEHVICPLAYRGSCFSAKIRISALRNAFSIYGLVLS